MVVWDTETLRSSTVSLMTASGMSTITSIWVTAPKKPLRNTLSLVSNKTHTLSILTRYIKITTPTRFSRNLRRPPLKDGIRTSWYPLRLQRRERLLSSLKTKSSPRSTTIKLPLWSLSLIRMVWRSVEYRWLASRYRHCCQRLYFERRCQRPHCYQRWVRSTAQIEAFGSHRLYVS